MTRVLKFKTYSFLHEELSSGGDTPLLEMNMGFNQGQMGIEPSNPLGPGYGFAVDPTMSIYSDDSSPYIDNYARTSGMVNDLAKIIRSLQSAGITTTAVVDRFLEDVDEFGNLRILRIVKNCALRLDIFISFEFRGEEYFGVYRNFNGSSKPGLKSEFFGDRRLNYVNGEYYLKLSSYLFRALTNWFVPRKGRYICLADEYTAPKDSFGRNLTVKKGNVVEVVGTSVGKDGDPYVMIKNDGENYKVVGNDYYFFKYNFQVNE